MCGKAVNYMIVVVARVFFSFCYYIICGHSCIICMCGCVYTSCNSLRYLTLRCSCLRSSTYTCIISMVCISVSVLRIYNSPLAYSAHIVFISVCMVCKHICAQLHCFAHFHTAACWTMLLHVYSLLFMVVVIVLYTFVYFSILLIVRLLFAVFHFSIFLLRDFALLPLVPSLRIWCAFFLLWNCEETEETVETAETHEWSLYGKQIFDATYHVAAKKFVVNFNVKWWQCAFVEAVVVVLIFYAGEEGADGWLTAFSVKQEVKFKLKKKLQQIQNASREQSTTVKTKNKTSVQYSTDLKQKIIKSCRLS